MGLETGTYISDLVATNPTPGDPKSQGDDHLRLVKSTVKATFPNVSGAVTPTHTELNYVDGVTSAIQTQLDQAKLTNGTAVNLSGASVDFTSIPSWVKRVTLNFAGLSTNGTSLPMVQIGDSGGIETTGYAGSNAVAQDSLSTTAANSTAGFIVCASVAASSVISGVVTLNLIGANYWTCSVVGGVSGVDAAFFGGGFKEVSATLDRIRLTTAGGTDTFDGGTANIQYE